MGDDVALRVRLQLDFSGSRWLAGSLLVDEEVRPLEASYVVDTPRQIVQATRAALAGHGGDVAWNQEPGGEMWRLAAAGDGALTLSAQEAARLPDRGWMPNETASVYVVDGRAWARTVVRCLDHLGQVGDYEGHWVRPFPAEELDALREWFGSTSSEAKGRYTPVSLLAPSQRCRPAQTALPGRSQVGGEPHVVGTLLVPVHHPHSQSRRRQRRLGVRFRLADEPVGDVLVRRDAKVWVVLGPGPRAVTDELLVLCSSVRHVLLGRLKIAHPAAVASREPSRAPIHVIPLQRACVLRHGRRVRALAAESR